jgi:methylmalonyl-CoA mutase
MSQQEQWVNQLKKELKAETLSEFQSDIEGLRWEFTDNNKSLPSFDFSNTSNASCIFYSFYKVKDAKQSNIEILKDLNQGTQGLLICWDKSPDFDQLFNGVLFEYIQSRVMVRNTEDFTLINQWIKQRNPANFTVELSTFQEDATLRIDGFSMHAVGANAWQELAYVCKELEMQLLIIPQNQEITVEFGVGENFMIEAVKITAFQWLSEALITKHGRKDLNITLRARLGWRNKSVGELHTNQIRQTSEALCALVAGVNQLCITPYDQFFEEDPSELSRRMAVNIGHILKEESHLDWFNGLIKGSYITTHLIHQLCNKVWEELALTEGFEDKLKSAIQATISLRKMRISDQNDRFIGINYLMNTSEKQAYSPKETGALGLPYLFFETI